VTTASSQSRLLDKLLLAPDALTDLRVLMTEYHRNQARLDEGRSRRYSYPTRPHEFASLEERNAYFELERLALLQRKHLVALTETQESLVQQLALMADGLTPDELDELLTQIPLTPLEVS
jgi:hypothetical protein